MKEEILNDIYNQVGRQIYKREGLPERLKGRIKRKYKENIEINIIEDLIRNAIQIYKHASKILPNFIMPRTTKYANPQSVNMDAVVKELKEQYPEFEIQALNNIAGWAMYWEHLR